MANEKSQAQLLAEWQSKIAEEIKAVEAEMKKVADRMTELKNLTSNPPIKMK